MKTSIPIALLLLLPSLSFAQQWGTVRGTVVWGGDAIPKRDVFNLEKNTDKDFCVSKGPVADESWVIDPKTKGVRDLFVWLAPVEKGAKLAVHPKRQAVEPKQVFMDQPICSFIPRALAMREGQELVAKNSSGIAHNFRYSGHPNRRNNEGNLLIAAGKHVVLDKLEADRIPIRVSCNVHPWMQGWIRVFDHPYFAVTDEHGQFEIKDAPAGSVRLMVWHGTGGWLGGSEGREGSMIEVKSDTNLGKLVYPPPK